jgi:type II secretory pathway component PulF
MSVLKARDLDEFSAPRAKGAAARSPLAVFAIHAALWAGVALVLTLGVPRFAAIFADFGVALPRVTTALIRVARHRLAVVGAVAVVLSVDGIVLGDPARRAGARAWLAMMALVPVVLLGATVAALALPVVTFMTRLSG